MSNFKKDQAVILKSRLGKETKGIYKGEINRGSGKGGGLFLEVEVNGTIKKTRPSMVRAA